MKKAAIALAVLLAVVLAALVWLAGSVGPETAPDELKTRPVAIDNA